MVVEHRNNSVIFKDTYSDNDLSDLSLLGTVTTYLDESVWKITVNQENHYLSLGDAIYYDFQSNHYNRALANNTIMSEVIGIVSNVINNNEFELTLRGEITIDRYNSIEENTLLYLSSIIPGKLVKDEPSAISKIIAKKTNNGINVDIQRGYHLITNDEPIYYNPRKYTQEELSEIVTRIKNDIY